MTSNKKRGVLAAAALYLCLLTSAPSAHAAPAAKDGESFQARIRRVIKVIRNVLVPVIHDETMGPPKP